MKQVRQVLAGLSLALSLFSASAFAAGAPLAPGVAPNPQAAFFAQARALIASCSFQPFTVDGTGRRVYAPLRSRCRELQVIPGAARFVLNGRVYVITLTESPYSDGGDLDNIVIRDTVGNTLIQLQNVPAFGDPILGILGGHANLPQIQIR